MYREYLVNGHLLINAQMIRSFPRRFLRANGKQEKHELNTYISWLSLFINALV